MTRFFLICTSYIGREKGHEAEKVLKRKALMGQTFLIGAAHYGCLLCLYVQKYIIY